MDRTKNIFLFLVLGLISSSRADESPECHEEYTRIPPFYVTTVGSGSTESFNVHGASTVTGRSEILSTEKIREVSAPSAQRASTAVAPVTGLIGKGSVVTIEGGDREFWDKIVHGDIEPQSKGQQYVPIRVNESNTQYAQHKFEAQQSLFVQDQALGKVHYRSLKPAKATDFYIITEDTPLFYQDRMIVAMPGIVLEPMHKKIGEEDFFKTVLCPDGAGGMTLTYRFHVVGENNFSINEVSWLAGNSCEYPLHVRPIDPVTFNGLLAVQEAFGELSHGYEPNLSEFEVNDWGRVRLPYDAELNIGRMAELGPAVTYTHYRQSNVSPGSDTWGYPDTICALMKFAKKWNKTCYEAGLARAARQTVSRIPGPGIYGILGDACTLQIGDIGFITPALKQDTTKDPLGHSSHKSGRCIDVRPVRNDGEFVGTNYESPSYDQTLTRLLVSELKKAGATNVLFNDPDVSAGRMEGHDDHVHFCLESPTALEGCQARLNP